IIADLSTSAAAIKEHTGKYPRIVTWPYGAWSVEVNELAAKLGLETALTLHTGEKLIAGDNVIQREMIVSNPGAKLFADMVAETRKPLPVRAAQVDLDYVYDPDPEQQERNLGRLLDRIHDLGLSHVFLQGFADPDADGAADALYFPNRHLPMRADLFNRVAWQLKTRAEVDVFAWMPLLAFTGPDIDADWRVVQQRGDDIGPDPAGEPRLSPFNDEARQFIKEIYVDLAQHANFSGIHFHDDGRMNEYEDVSPAAMEFYEEQLGKDFSIAAARNDTELMHQWAGLKASTMIEFSEELVDAVSFYRPKLQTSRNIFASALLDDFSIVYLAQDYEEYLQTYDYVALMAMPLLENVSDSSSFYAQLIDIVSEMPQGTRQTIFQLQTVDWKKQKPLPSDQLRDTFLYLQTQGVRNLAYYPEDFIQDRPELHELKRGLSLTVLPERPQS
ncbi:MAG: poly-beta-1,6-N-acetyl-D-glucosamine N-deacetylase PgaB, partial [Gammaproteobacteria bacterium]